MSHPALPAEFLERVQRIVREGHYGEVVESFSATKRTSFRVNTLRCEAADVAKQLSGEGVELSSVSWCDHAFEVTAQQREAVTHSQLVTDGKIYVQGLSSIFASLVPL